MLLVSRARGGSSVLASRSRLGGGGSGGQHCRWDPSHNARQDPGRSGVRRIVG